MTPIFIYAGDARQAETFVGWLNRAGAQLDRRDWRYVFDPDDVLHGYEGVEILTWGIYYRRPDLGRLLSLAQVCDWRICRIEWPYP